MKIKNFKINKNNIGNIIAGTVFATFFVPTAMVTLFLAGGLVYVATNYDPTADDFANEATVDDGMIAYEDNVDSMIEKEDEPSVSRFEANAMIDIDALYVIENFKANPEVDYYVYQAAGWTGVLSQYHVDYSISDTNGGKPLADYLTDEEKEQIAKNDGKVTKAELNDIMNRIIGDYQKNISQSNKSLKLTDN